MSREFELDETIFHSLSELEMAKGAIDELIDAYCGYDIKPTPQKALAYMRLPEEKRSKDMKFSVKWFEDCGKIRWLCYIARDYIYKCYKLLEETQKETPHETALDDTAKESPTENSHGLSKSILAKEKNNYAMTGETWKGKLIELINTYDISEETLEFYFWFVVEGIKRGK